METTTQSAKAGGIVAFEYPAGPEDPSSPVWGEWEGTEPEKAPAAAAKEAQRDGARGAAEAALRAEFDRRLAEETRRSFEAGREKGRLEGRQAEREAQAAAQAAAEERRARQAAELIESFAQERDKYMLAVAARILRREAQMDPLLLTGAVRVALGQLAGTTQVRLRVPAPELELWTATVALLPNLAQKPSVVAGEGMRLGDCAIETELGSVDLGIRSQLGEIERGFFDRAGGQRPDPAPKTNETAILAGAGRA